MLIFYILLPIVLYIICSYIYLQRISKNYLAITTRDDVSTRKLKTYDEIQAEFADKGAINILVLSGGGVRGYVPLHILSYIEQATGKKIGELFDAFAGTSTGAISIAGILCPQEDGTGFANSATKIKNHYYDSCIRMFSSPWYHQLLTLFGFIGPRYLPDGKLEVLTEYCGNFHISEVNKLFLVPVYDMYNNEMLVVRNWVPRYSNNTEVNYKLRDLIHGASNPPMLFPAQDLMINGKEMSMIDPALLVNNPIMSMLTNARLLFIQKKIRIINIGNGGLNTIAHNHTSMIGFGALGLLKYVLNSPNLNHKMAQDTLASYIAEAQDYDNKIEFINIDMYSEDILSSTDVSVENMKKLKKFAHHLLVSNKDKIDNLCNTLMKDQAQHD